MSLSIGEKIAVLIKRKGITVTQLAEKMGQTRQNLSNKMSRDNFTAKEAKQVAEVLGIEFVYYFRDEDGSEI